LGADRRGRRHCLCGAGFIFALDPGHNIPFIGGTPGLGKELAIMTAVTLVAALVLVESHTWLTIWERRRAILDEVAS
jgi:hypothetical protein